MGVNTRKCTVLVAILYHTKFQEEMARIVRPYYKRASAHWCLVLLEFVLCELRKGDSSGARIYREPTSSMIKKFAGRTKLPAWARKAQAPGTQQKSRQTLGAKGARNHLQRAGVRSSTDSQTICTGLRVRVPNDRMTKENASDKAT